MSQESLYKIFSEAGFSPRFAAKLDHLISQASTGEDWTYQQVCALLLRWRAVGARKAAAAARQEVYDATPRSRRPLTATLFDASYRKPHGDGAERSGSGDSGA